MAIINETYDATHSAGMGNYRVLEGDIFNATLGSGDFDDGMNFEGFDAQKSYTVSVDLSTLTGTTTVFLMNQFTYAAAYFRIIDGVLTAAGAQDLGFLETSIATLDGNRLSFDFTSDSLRSYSFRVEGDGSPLAYSVSFAETIIPDPITELDDIFIGTIGDDDVSLLGGNDTFDGDAGNDTVNGDAGNDTLTGGEGNDMFVVGFAEGADVITDFTVGEDRLDLQSYGVNAIEDLAITDTVGGARIDLGEDNAVLLEGVAAADLGNEVFVLVDNIVTGGDAPEKLHGKSGVDIMSGGLGDDHLNGLDGNDSLDGGSGRDKLVGGLGNDTATGGDGNDLLRGDDGDDVMSGGNNNDRLHGGNGNDVLNADAGNDKLYGDAGDDILDGGTGKDVMSGGAGSDTFVFAQGSHRDVITDFEDGLDVLDFSGHLGVNSLTDVTVTQAGTSTLVVYGGSDHVTLLNTNAVDIDSSDFIFV